jgi:hypothetical protein
MAKRYLLDIQAGSMCTTASPSARGWPGPQSSKPCSFDKLTTPAFKRKMIRIADELGLDPSMLAAVMMFETAGSMRADIQNSIMATGLIQFMPTTAKLYGTTVDALKRLTPEEQLDWVKVHFSKQAKRIKSLEDHYLAVFMPAYVGMDPSSVVGRRGSSEAGPGGLTKGAVYAANQGFDRGGKGYYTVADIGATVVSLYNAAKSRPPIEVDMSSWSSLGGLVIPIALGAAAGFGVAWGIKELRR